MSKLTDVQKSERLERFRERAQQEELIRQNHKANLAKDHGLENHPKLDLLYSKAWDLGHANGFSEVATYFDDLAELIK